MALDRWNRGAPTLTIGASQIAQHRRRPCPLIRLIISSIPTALAGSVAKSKRETSSLRSISRGSAMPTAAETRLVINALRVQALDDYRARPGAKHTRGSHRGLYPSRFRIRHAERGAPQLRRHRRIREQLARHHARADVGGFRRGLSHADRRHAAAHVRGTAGNAVLGLSLLHRCLHLPARSDRPHRPYFRELRLLRRFCRDGRCRPLLPPGSGRWLRVDVQTRAAGIPARPRTRS